MSVSSSLNNTAGLQVGVRVVRGPDWKWTNQDDGEGHLGTVIEIGRPGSKTSPDKTVVVQWDSGNKTNYRVGYQGAYDLRLFDNAPAGVRHGEYSCGGCESCGIVGMRWHCSRCSDFDLCNPCYNDGKHDTNHSFIRYTAPNSKGTRVSKRSGVTQIIARGIFPGAVVERGPAWEWGNQDGGDGKQGRVLDIRGWDSETGRSVANVVWFHAATNVYRLGHKGKADLKYRQASKGGQFYRDHLPVLGDPSEYVENERRKCPFSVGNRVKVEMEPDVLKAMQEGHGGWNPKMAEYIGKIGTVHRITDKGDIRVQYEGCNHRWTFHSGALTKIQAYNVGEAVMIITDVDQIKELQKNHGEWTDGMTSALGRIGKVVKVYSDGDLRVSIDKQIWTFNPACCVPRPQDQLHIDNTTSADDGAIAAAKSGDKTSSSQSDSQTVTRNTSIAVDDVSERVQTMSMLDQIMSVQEDPGNPDSLVKEAAQGRVEIVQSLVEQHPEQVNSQSAGKTALQVAAHQGHLDVVMLLLSSNADPEIKDIDQDTALHYSAFGNQPEVMKVLLEKGANINTVNKGGCSALHVAVNKQHTDCVQVLLDNGCDVNIQDAYGDLAQHDAIGKDNEEIVTLLTEHPSSNFELQNHRGFNALHHAALKGNAFAAEKILARAPAMVDSRKSDGFSALHLAALNGHGTVAQALIEKGSANIEIRNNRQQTPLMLAVTQGHLNVIQLLVAREANVNAEEEDADTPLHLAFFRETHTSKKESVGVTSGAVGGDNAAVSQLGASSSAVTESPAGDEPSLCVQIIRFLAENGSDVMHKDTRGRTPLDLASNSSFPELREFLEQYKKIEEPVICIVCDEEEVNVVFQPCGHKVACLECCGRMKKCLSCQAPIESKLDIDGAELVLTEKADKEAKELTKKLQEMEDTLTCSICLDRKRNVAFLCGHSACSECSQPLRQCHMCRKPIAKRINLFV